MNRNYLSMQIYLSYFDQDEYNEKIAEFCKNSSVSDILKRNLELALEELVKNNIAIFIEHNDERGLPIEVVIEHYGVSDSAEMTITYGGDRYNPISDGDELSAYMAHKLFSSIKYSYEDSTNVIVVEFE